MPSTPKQDAAFALVDVKTGEPILNPRTGDQYRYAYYGNAVRRVRALSASGVKGRIVIDHVSAIMKNKWRSREIGRQAGNELKFAESVYYLQSQYADLHFIRRAKIDPTKIAYTESETDGIRDKQTVISLRKYLQRYFRNLFTDEAMESICEKDMIHIGKSEVFFATTPDEIERVYLEGPTSCMSYEAGDEDIRESIHPVRVYGAGDLAVAYMRNARGKINARTICRPEKKVYGRLYGASGRLREALEAQGFKRGRGEDFVGSKFLIEPSLGGFYWSVNFSCTKPSDAEIISKILKQPASSFKCGKSYTYRMLKPFLDAPLDVLFPVSRNYAINPDDVEFINRKPAIKLMYI